MSEKNQYNPSIFIDNLPEETKRVVFAGVWEERTDEIAKKYSLNETQTDDLINDVLYVLIGLENPDNFLETIITELGISRLLAEQIMNDLEVRVFEYAVKSIENKTPISEQTIIQKTVLDAENDIPEVRPEITPEIEPNILPAVEKGEIAHNTPKPPISPTVPTAKPSVWENPRAVLGQNELVQKPIAVPRYTGVTLEEEKESSQQPVVSSQKTPEQIASSVSSTPPEPVAQPVKKYAVDPYREALE